MDIPQVGGSHAVSYARIGDYPLSVERAVGVGEYWRRGGASFQFENRWIADIPIEQRGVASTHLSVSRLLESDAPISGQSSEKVTPTVDQHAPRYAYRPGPGQLYS